MIDKKMCHVFLRSKYSFLNQHFSDKKGEPHWDIRSIEPSEVVGIIIYDDGSEEIKRFKVKHNPDAIHELEAFLRQDVLFIIHDIKYELFALWSLGLKPSFKNVFDTWVAASCIWMGEQKSGDEDTDGDFEDDKQGTILKQNRERAEWLKSISLSGLGTRAGEGPSAPPKKDYPSVNFRIGENNFKALISELRELMNVYPFIQQLVTSKGLERLLFEIEFPYAEALADIAWTGCRPDEAARRMLERESKKAMTALASKLNEHGISAPDSAHQFEQFIAENGLANVFTEKTKKNNTSQKLKVLKTKKGKHPAIGLLYDYRRFSRILRIWGTQSRWPISKCDGRVHAWFWQNCQVTGRTGTERPVLTNMEAATKPLIMADDNNVLVESDKASFEFAVAAALHGDFTLLNLYLSSENLYQEMIEKHVDSDLEVNKAKKAFLSMLNGATAYKIALDTNILEDEAQDFLNKIELAFPDLFRNRELHYQESLSLGAVPIIMGLSRKLHTDNLSEHKIKCRIFNTAIQGTAAAIFKLSVVKIHRRFAGTSVKIILVNHDSVLIECPKDFAAEVSAYLPIASREAGEWFFPELKLKARVYEPSKCWGNRQTFDAYIQDLIAAQRGDDDADN